MADAIHLTEQPENTDIMKRFLAIAALTAAILATTALGATPTYIELGIPVVKHLGGGAFWYERQQAELQFADTAGVLFTHRQVGTAYPNSRPGDHHPAARAVLAVWPIGGGVVEGFHVALVTANPSLLYRLAKGFD